MGENQAAVQIGGFIQPTQFWLVDFRYLVAALLVLILGIFAINGYVGLGIGLFAFCVFFFFLYRGVKRLTLSGDRLSIHSLFIKTLEIQITTRGCCRGRLISLKENCVLIFEAFEPQCPKPTGRACSSQQEKVELLLPRLTPFNHPSYVSLVQWLNSRGIDLDAPEELDSELEELDLSGSRVFITLLFIFAAVLVILAFISLSSPHPL